MPPQVKKKKQLPHSRYPNSDYGMCELPIVKSLHGGEKYD